ncbi:ABC transporter substrate-binding protein [Silvanigrella aquatica]|uniref:ABC transporter substrate-binding protein n=1 Tax=Silvanigrella aquatica TaxID=1915309 RepID=A0A1L4D053_9BACT|nr:ABC transporter substrate-binding protein [Silvanigrella aquatica]APJ03574.1 hypothetical protein AXG55_06490 [Silvanigrella aquatica]
MSKKMILLLLSLVGILAAVIMLKRSKPTDDHITIGLLQFASFPPLDEAKEGFIAQVKKDFGNKVTIIEQNAQGSVTQAQAIASSFKANGSITGFYAIATPAVQALKSEIKDRPIAFAAVTDPVGLHLRGPDSNITGATDMADIEKQIRILKELMPDIKKVAILYNPGESNSVILVKKMKVELAKYDILFQDNGANSQSDVAAATLHAVQNAQAILIPTDNTISSAFPIVKQIADKAKIPLIITWTGEKEIPLMQFGVDYTQSGVQAAELVKQMIADGIKPWDTPLVAPNSKVFISSEELKKHGINLPESLKQEVTLL